MGFVLQTSFFLLLSFVIMFRQLSRALCSINDGELCIPCKGMQRSRLGDLTLVPIMVVDLKAHRIVRTEECFVGKFVGVSNLGSILYYPHFDGSYLL